MRKTIIALLCFGAIKAAHAATNVNLVVSSVTYTGIAVTSGTVRRIDNVVRGSTVAIDSTRIGIEVQNMHASANFYCAYDTGFSTAAPSSNVGILQAKKVEPGDVIYAGLLRQASYFCMAEDFANGTTVWAHVENVYKE